jgi:hypothetical protein
VIRVASLRTARFLVRAFDAFAILFLLAIGLLVAELLAPEIASFVFRADGAVDALAVGFSGFIAVFADVGFAAARDEDEEKG